MDIWATLADERRATADVLAGLTDQQWSTQSLCSAWTVKEVAVHLLPATGTGIPGLVWAMVKARGDLHRALREVTIRDAAEVTTDQIVSDLRDQAEHRMQPPGVGPLGPYTDLLVHRLDIVVPLGIELDRPAEPWRRSLDFLVGPKARRAGFVDGALPDVRLRATDLDWSHGDGPEVVGPAAALGLTLCGRAAWLDRLSGGGVESLTAWVA